MSPINLRDLLNFKTKRKSISIDEVEPIEELTKRFDNTMLFEKEKDMLDAFLQLVEDADIL